MMNRFRELSVKTGVPMSEMLRRMIKEYLRKEIQNRSSVNDVEKIVDIHEKVII